jgi:hypothetical protein
MQPWGGRGRFMGGGMSGGYGRRGPHEIETKPFFLTSEFLGTAMAITALAITAAVMDNLGVRLTWILITAMVCAYVLSRGIAKSATKSRSYDPREELFRGDGAAHERQHEGAGNR